MEQDELRKIIIRIHRDSSLSAKEKSKKIQNLYNTKTVTVPDKIPACIIMSENVKYLQSAVINITNVDYATIYAKITK